MRWLEPGDEPLLLAVWNDPAFMRNVADRVAASRRPLSEYLADFEA